MKAAKPLIQTASKNESYRTIGRFGTMLPDRWPPRSSLSKPMLYLSLFILTPCFRRRGLATINEKRPDSG